MRSLGLLVKAVALCNDAVLEPMEGDIEYRAVGDPTEGALVVAAARLGLWKPQLETRWPRVAEVPFTSERKRMTTVHRVNVSPEQTDAPWKGAPFVAFCKGGVDEILEITIHVWTGDQIAPLTDELHRRIVGIELDALRGIEQVIGVAGGEAKAEAILGALRGGRVNVLVTDDAAAQRVLDLDRN